VFHQERFEAKNVPLGAIRMIFCSAVYDSKALFVPLCTIRREPLNPCGSKAEVDFTPRHSFYNLVDLTVTKDI
jgi:hypothetical protein